MNKHILLSLVACLVGSAPAYAQGALGPPVAAEKQVELGYGPNAPALYHHASVSAESRPRRPVLHQMAQRMLSPIRAVLGHLMPPRGEELPSRDAVSRMIADGGYSPAEITAAKIKIDEAQAQARRAAVRYLGTIDCHYYPEAEAGLVAALRADRAEAVRYEAALALGNSRGFTEKMLEALNMTALALELDGNPAETSERVRSAAQRSLERCVERGLALPPLAQQAVSAIDCWLPPDPLAVQPVGYYLPAYVARPPISARERQIAETIGTQPREAAPPSGLRSFFQSLFGREPARGQRNAVDPRLSGLAPLGAVQPLAIPTEPQSLAPMQPYNYH